MLNPRQIISYSKALTKVRRKESYKDTLIRRDIMKCEWMLQEAREAGFELGFKQGIEQFKEGTIVSSLQAKLSIQLIAKITRTTDEKVKEVAKKHHLEELLLEA